MHDVGEIVVVTHRFNGEREQIIKINDSAFALQHLNIAHDFGNICDGSRRPASTRLNCRGIAIGSDISRSCPINVGGQIIDVGGVLRSNDLANQSPTIRNHNGVALALFVPPLAQ